MKKICAECDNVIKTGIFSNTFYSCRREFSTVFSYVSGKNKTIYHAEKQCYKQNKNGTCDYYKPKKSLKQKVLNWWGNL